MIYDKVFPPDAKEISFEIIDGTVCKIKMGVRVAQTTPVAVYFSFVF
jgi:hypothetical protein